METKSYGIKRIVVGVDVVPCGDTTQIGECNGVADVDRHVGRIEHQDRRCRAAAVVTASAAGHGATDADIDVVCGIGHAAQQDCRNRKYSAATHRGISTMVP